MCNAQSRKKDFFKYKLCAYHQKKSPLPQKQGFYCNNWPSFINTTSKTMQSSLV